LSVLCRGGRMLESLVTPKVTELKSETRVMRGGT
jgi:hypothetical protein